MEELWRKTSELMWERPLLWLPVLVADLLGFLVNLGSLALVRSMVLGRLQYHSALGGAPVRASLTPAAMEHATVLAMLITWPANFLRLLLYATAFVVTAALVRGFARREKNPASDIPSALRRHAEGIVSLSLRALAVYACIAALLDWMGKLLAAQGHKTVLANPWVETGSGVVLLAFLAWLVAPAAVQVLAQRRPAMMVRRQALAFAFALGLVSFALARFVGDNMRAVHIASPVARFALELTGSWISALPYAVLFVALARMALKVEAEEGLAPQGEPALPQHRTVS